MLLVNEEAFGSIYGLSLHVSAKVHGLASNSCEAISNMGVPMGQGAGGGGVAGGGVRRETWRTGRRGNRIDRNVARQAN